MEALVHFETLKQDVAILRRKKGATEKQIEDRPRHALAGTSG